MIKSESMIKSELFRESEYHNKEVDISEPFFNFVIMIVLFFPHLKEESC
jgi:hypothetical protein